MVTRGFCFPRESTLLAGGEKAPILVGRKAGEREERGVGERVRGAVREVGTAPGIAFFAAGCVGKEVVAATRDRSIGVVWGLPSRHKGRDT